MQSQPKSRSTFFSFFLQICAHSTNFAEVGQEAPVLVIVINCQLLEWLVMQLTSSHQLWFTRREILHTAGFQRQKNSVGVSALPSGEFLREQHCPQKQVKTWHTSGKFLDSLESFLTVWNVSGQGGEYPDSLETFQTVWKVFWKLRKVSIQPGKFPDSLESFQTV